MTRETGESLDNELKQTVGSADSGRALGDEGQADRLKAANQQLAASEQQLRAVNEHLRESEERYRELYNDAPVGYREMDAAGRIVRINETGAGMLGYTVKEMVGRSIFDFVSSSQRRQAQEAWKKKTEGREPARGFERKYLCKDGSEIDVYIEDRIIANADGKVETVRSTASDITQRKAAEEALAQERNLLRTLIDNMPDLIYVKDAKYRFIAGNSAVAAYMGATTLDVLAGKTDMDFYPKALAKQFNDREQEIIRSGKALVNYEECTTNLFGNRKWFLTTKVPLRDSNDKVVGLVGIGRDITDRKTAEEQQRKLLELLEEKNRELESIIHVAGHDLRTPLVTIAGFSGELAVSCEHIREVLDEPETPETLRQRLGETVRTDIPEAAALIKTSAARISSLLDGLTRLAKLGFAAAEIEPLDMNAMMAETLGTVEFQARQAGAGFEVESLPMCFGDESQISLIFSNLISNALKNLDPARPGLVRVSGWTDKDNLLYCVEDNGAGIADDELANIFKMFYRVNPDKGSGDGLGLAIVRRIVNRHNGKVWVESEVGKGSKFFVSLPNRRH